MSSRVPSKQRFKAGFPSFVATGAVLLGSVLATTAPASGQARISQVGIGAGLTGNSADGKFIELYNAGPTPVSLVGKSLQWAATASSIPSNKKDLSGTIASHSYYLVRLTTETGTNDRYPNIYGIPFTADETYYLGSSTVTTPISVVGIASGKVILANTTTLFTTSGCAAPDAASVLDLVSWDDVPSNVGCYEGAAGMPVIAPMVFGYGVAAVTRRCGGLSDTNDNAADFVNTARPPRNSSYPANAESVPAVNAMTQLQTPYGRYFVTYEMNRQQWRAYQGQTVRFTAFAAPCSGTIASLTVNLSAVGGSATQTLYDDGSHGDVTAGDGLRTFDYVLPGPATAPLSTAANPQYLITYTATDSSGRVGLGRSPLVVDPVPPANDLCGNAQVIPGGPAPFFASVSGSNVSATSGTTTPMGACCAADHSCTVTLRPDCTGAYWKSGGVCSTTSLTCASEIGPDLASWIEAPFGGVKVPCAAGNGYGSTSRDVWFSYTPQVSFAYTISTCNTGTASDTVLTILDTCPPDETNNIPSALACNDAGCQATIFGSPATIIAFQMEAGTQYLIRLASFGSGMSILGGSYEMTITSSLYGACCTPTGVCTQGNRDQCTGNNVYQGDNTTCGTFLLCTGACCNPTTGACSITGPGNCNGDFASLGLGVSCNPNFCPQPAASACCRGATCTVLAAGNCVVSVGVAGATVSSVLDCNLGSMTTPCCYADYNKANGLSVQDIFDFLNDWFAGVAFANTGGDGVSGTLTVQNIFDFLGAWFAGGC